MKPAVSLLDEPRVRFGTLVIDKVPVPLDIFDIEHYDDQVMDERRGVEAVQTGDPTRRDGGYAPAKHYRKFIIHARTVETASFTVPFKSKFSVLGADGDLIVSGPWRFDRSELVVNGQLTVWLPIEFYSSEPFEPFG